MRPENRNVCDLISSSQDLDWQTPSTYVVARPRRGSICWTRPLLLSVT